MLTYLFRAYFADGTTYDQAPDDEAMIAERLVSFADVVNLQNAGAKLITFALFFNPELGDVSRNPVAAVNLDTGYFEVGGIEFHLYGVAGLGKGLARKVIYYRQAVPATETTRYVIGWEATIAGRNVQHMIALDG